MINKQLGTKGINVNIKLEDITGNTENINTSITGFTANNGITYYDIPTFIKISDLSDKTIRRRISSVENKKDKWRYVIAPDGHKLYVSCMLANIKRFFLSNTLKDDYVKFLSAYSWSIKGTLRPQYCPTPEASRKASENFFNAIKKNFKGVNLIFWYVTEQNPNKDGFHCHFLLGSPDKDYDTLKNWINRYLGSFNTSKKTKKRLTNSHIDNYDINGDWLNYATKQMHLLPDAYGWLDSFIN
ncbi:MAG: hypothetical protein HXX18_02515 [Bacteroidetes bacterium]|nr:hypothetical protein [Bacteroidota bacterium]